LTWLHQHSKGDLQTLYTKPKYILHVNLNLFYKIVLIFFFQILKVSTYQMVILLLFNKLPDWTVERMQDETQIKADLFLQVLCGLLKSKLITCPELNDEELEEDIKETDVKMNYNIQINNDFRRYVVFLINSTNL
jgi:hypothetical protein